MASSSGTSSGSSILPNSGSEEDLQAVMDQRKKKRMLSNRESARRSRMRKQKLLDELTAQVTQLMNENGRIVTALNITNQHYLVVEAENSVLRTQMAELRNWLQSLNEILYYMNRAGDGRVSQGPRASDDDEMMSPWDMVFMNQPIMTSAEMFQYS